jgi:hypothetical protein
MQGVGALMVVLAGVCQAILTIYAIPAEERRNLRETTGAVTKSFLLNNRWNRFIWLLFLSCGVASVMFGAAELPGLAALSFVVTLFLFGILGGQSLLVWTFGIALLPTNALPTTTKTALQVTAVLLGTVGAIPVFLAGRI